MSKDQKTISHAISGGLSGLVTMALTYPLVTLSTKAQVSNKSDVDERQKESKKLDEFRQLYNGLESALVGIVAVNFTYYYFYNLFSKKLSNKKTGNLNVKNSIITGLIAGIISRIFTNPIWVANTRMTVNSKKGIKLNTISAIKNILKHDGIKGLFSGLQPALILVLSPVIQYTIFEQLKNLVLKKKKRLSSLDALYLGSLGKLIATIMTYPYYTIRSRMHLKDKDDKRNMVQIFIDIIKLEGFNSLYLGLFMKLLQSVISAGFLFYFKEEFVEIVDKLVRGINFKRRK